MGKCGGCFAAKGLRASIIMRISSTGQHWPVYTLVGHILEVEVAEGGCRCEIISERNAANGFPRAEMKISG